MGANWKARHTSDKQEAAHRRPVTVQAWSQRSTLTTFKPAAGDQAVDAFIPLAAAYAPKALPPRAPRRSTESPAACTENQSDPD